MPQSYLNELAEDIELIPDRREILELMVAIGKQLKDFPEEQRSEANRVPGCISSVYVAASLDDSGYLHFRGSSEGHITRGYVQALFQEFDGDTPAEFLARAELTVAGFLQRTNLAQSVLATRANSIGNILLTMKKQVLKLAAGVP